MESREKDKESLQHPAGNHADSVVAIAMDHEGRVDSHQRAIESVTSWIGRPATLYWVLGLSFLWIVFNDMGSQLGFRPWDKPPFPILESLWTLGALLTAIAVLITQNRESKRDQHQAQLTLQLSLLADHKTAKIIELLEELRRDMPQVRNRVDEEADKLTKVVEAEVLAGDLEKRMSEGEAQVKER